MADEDEKESRVATHIRLLCQFFNLNRVSLSFPLFRFLESVT